MSSVQSYRRRALNARRSRDHVLADFLTQEELCKQLGLTITGSGGLRTLWRWRRSRTGPDPTWIGGRIVYSKDAVRRWLAGQEKKMVRARSRATSIGASE
jgi:hypothetical protein